MQDKNVHTVDQEVLKSSQENPFPKMDENYSVSTHTIYTSAWTCKKIVPTAVPLIGNYPKQQKFNIKNIYERLKLLCFTLHWNVFCKKRKIPLYTMTIQL